MTKRCNRDNNVTAILAPFTIHIVDLDKVNIYFLSPPYQPTSATPSTQHTAQYSTAQSFCLIQLCAFVWMSVDSFLINILWAFEKRLGRWEFKWKCIYRILAMMKEKGCMPLTLHRCWRNGVLMPFVWSYDRLCGRHCFVFILLLWFTSIHGHARHIFYMLIYIREIKSDECSKRSWMYRFEFNRIVWNSSGGDHNVHRQYVLMLAIVLCSKHIPVLSDS